MAQVLDDDLLELLTQINAENYSSGDDETVLPTSQPSVVENLVFSSTIQDTTSTEHTLFIKEDELSGFMETLARIDTENLTPLQPEFPIASIEATNKSTTNVKPGAKRKRRKQEVDHMRAVALALEQKLDTLKQEGGLNNQGANHFWKKVADQLLIARQQSVGENARLRQALEDQRKVIRAIQRSLSKAPDLEELGILPALSQDSDEQKPQYPSSNVNYNKLFEHIEASYCQVDKEFEELGIPISKLGERKINMQVGSEGDEHTMRIQVVESRYTPFSFSSVGSVTWSFIMEANDPALEKVGDDMYGASKFNPGVGPVEVIGHVAMRRYVDQNRFTLLWEGLSTYSREVQGPADLDIEDRGWAVFEPAKDDAESSVCRICVQFSLTPLKSKGNAAGSSADIQLTTEFVLSLYEKYVGYTIQGVTALLNQDITKQSHGTSGGCSTDHRQRDPFGSVYTAALILPPKINPTEMLSRQHTTVSSGNTKRITSESSSELLNRRAHHALHIITPPSSMESRSRRYIHSSSATQSLPSWSSSTSTSHYNPSIKWKGVSSRWCSLTALTILVLTIFSVGQLSRWWLFPSSNVKEQENNGWMYHLQQVEPKSQAEETQQELQEDKENEKFVFVPPVVSENDTLALLKRRERYDPGNHNADQRRVTEMVQWAWKGYATYAYGHDSLNVKTMTGTGLKDHDMALTLVDALDTLYLVGMFDEFDQASQWVADHMHGRIFKQGFISVFETTIRLMGGLLSSYYLSGQSHLLVMADKLGAALSPAFKVYPHGVPTKDYDIVKKRGKYASTLAEVGSLQLEFKYLSTLTGNRQYHNQVEKVMDSLAKDVRENYPSGLLPVNIRISNGRVTNFRTKITLGANGDSYYEYLLKQWLLSGKQDEKYKTRYLNAVQGIMDNLVGKSKPNGLVFIGEIVKGKFEPKMDHLVCFIPGMLALGYMHGLPKEHLTLAEQLLETCYQMYAQMATHLAPEIVYFNLDDKVQSDLIVSKNDAFNLLRPETVESLMILYRITKNEKYRQYGRTIMEAFETHCKLPKGGYASVSNVANGPPKQGFRSEMESFFIAETLKYLFLLFSDDSVLPLDEIVFNTEAHPFAIDQVPENELVIGSHELESKH